MALVLFANTKGGSGKTTAALVLAGELVKHRAKVVLLEGDPNRPLMNWASARGMAVIETSRSRVKSAAEAAQAIDAAATATDGEGRLAVVHDDDQEGVFDWIEGAASWAHFVIADPAVGGPYAVRRTRAGDAWDRRESESCAVPASAVPGDAPRAVSLGLPTLRVL